jgi:hypothetical protein
MDLNRQQQEKHGVDCSGSQYRQVESSCECNNEPSGSIKCRELY